MSDLDNQVWMSQSGGHYAGRTANLAEPVSVVIAFLVILQRSLSQGRQTDKETQSESYVVNTSCERIFTEARKVRDGLTGGMRKAPLLPR